MALLLLRDSAATDMAFVEITAEGGRPLAAAADGSEIPAAAASQERGQPESGCVVDNRCFPIVMVEAVLVAPSALHAVVCLIAVRRW